MVYRSDCRYLPYSIHFSEFMPQNVFPEKTDISQEYSYDMKMTADGYWARKALTVRDLLYRQTS